MHSYIHSCRHHFIFIVQPENNFAVAGGTFWHEYTDMLIARWILRVACRYILIIVITLSEICHTDRHNQWTVLHPKPEISNSPFPPPQQPPQTPTLPQVVMLTQLCETWHWKSHTKKLLVWQCIQRQGCQTNSDIHGFRLYIVVKQV
jgi:hypothetical protein